MFIKIVIAVVGFYLYKRLNGRRPHRTPRQARTEQRSSKEIGAAGEAAAQAKLRTTLRSVCGDDFYLHDGPLVIEHAPGTAFPTAEIDHLSITPFGVFVFETKNWSGRIPPSATPANLTRTAGNGTTEIRRSPIAQHRTKVRFLRDQLPPIWPVSGAGLFTSPEAVLDPELPSDLVSLDDLLHWMRVKRDTFKGPAQVDVARAKTAVLMYADSSTNALAAHTARVDKSRKLNRHQEAILGKFFH
ncbi:NERD domain-containing protein [Burkholderia sp. 8Y]|uniref:nuclease-related domain-containing protein n=1 Tax=Burkholderia sp. 8Y TaxID=2653133 RepID=UPI0012EF9582|nr:nuclease-related domain-containing protein [Burkholderia sp. 8Y]VXC82414.1 NERD domain-containing protein [Burkholderia sp. 8Y]